MAADAAATTTEIPLTQEQVEYLRRQAGAGAALRDALRWAVAAAFGVAVLGFAASKYGRRIPLLGILFLVYGIAAGAVCLVVLLLLSPLVALLLFPAAYFSGRGKLLADADSGKAVRVSGRLTLKPLLGVWTTLHAGDAKFELTRHELAALRPAVTTESGSMVLVGSVDRSMRAKRLLAVHDSGGHQLLDATASG